MRLDHIAVSAETLQAGADWVRAALGVPVETGGKHPITSTHNMLLSLGPEEYLEIIAIDPDAPPPGRRRAFGLDDFSGRPRITNWVCSVTGIDDNRPEGSGDVHDMTRGALTWRMGMPASGNLPFDGTQPAVIEWNDVHPAPSLPDRGCRLVALRVFHPEAEALAARLAGRLADPRITIAPGPEPRIEAEIDTPAGRALLG